MGRIIGHDAGRNVEGATETNMNKVLVTAKLRAPIAIKRDRQSERSSGVRSVAGTQIRGALASLYLQSGTADDAFQHLFLNESACRFGPLDPGPVLSPLTARACKREGLQHAFVDQLWFRIAQHKMDGSVLQDVGWRRCQECQQDLKGFDGFWICQGNSLCPRNSHQQHVAAHVGIDRHTQTAAQSIFYTLEAMLPQPSAEPDLYGWIMADDGAMDTLRELLSSAGGLISVGHHRTRGYGDLHMTLGEEPIVRDDMQFQERVETWNRELIRFLDSESVPDLEPEDFYFSLSLPAGAVLVDPFLRYTLDPADMITWLPAMPSSDTAFPFRNRPTKPLETGGTIRWITALAQHERLRGWNAAHGLPRQDEWNIDRGSVYVYCFHGTGGQRASLIQQLADMSADGIGLRRNEGFGMVSVSDDFHRRFSRQGERWVKQ